VFLFNDYITMTQWYTIILIIWWENDDARGVKKFGKKRTHLEYIFGKIRFWAIKSWFLGKIGSHWIFIAWWRWTDWLVPYDTSMQRDKYVAKCGEGNQLGGGGQRIANEIQCIILYMSQLRHQDDYETLTKILATTI